MGDQQSPRIECVVVSVVSWDWTLFVFALALDSAGNARNKRALFNSRVTNATAQCWKRLLCEASSGGGIRETEIRGGGIAVFALLLEKEMKNISSKCKRGGCWRIFGGLWENTDIEMII